MAAQPCTHHLKRDMMLTAASGKPQIISAAAMASAQDSLQGRPKLTGFAARSQGSRRGAAPLILSASPHSILNNVDH